MSEEAMKRALEFIDSVKVHPTQIASRDALHDALHTAIEAAKKQDPYAHIYETDSIYGLHRSLTCRLYNGRQPDRIVPVYTHPPEPAQPAPVQEPVLEVVNGQINRSWDAIPAGFTGLLYMQSQSNVPPKKPKEPWYGSARVDDYNRGWNDCIDSINATPQPSHMPQPLTDELIGQIIEQCRITMVNYCSDYKQTEFARAVEAAHGITGEPK
jgi:hypothetical protein